jgi:hypothetical protein
MGEPTLAPVTGDFTVTTGVVAKATIADPERKTVRMIFCRNI